MLEDVGVDGSAFPSSCCAVNAGSVTDRCVWKEKRFRSLQHMEAIRETAAAALPRPPAAHQL